MFSNKICFGHQFGPQKLETFQKFILVLSTLARCFPAFLHPGDSNCVFRTPILTATATFFQSPKLNFAKGINIFMKNLYFYNKKQLFYKQFDIQNHKHSKNVFFVLSTDRALFCRLFCIRLVKIRFLVLEKILYLHFCYILRAHRTLRVVRRAPKLDFSGYTPCHWQLTYLRNLPLELHA